MRNTLALLKIVSVIAFASGAMAVPAWAADCESLVAVRASAERLATRSRSGATMTSPDYRGSVATHYDVLRKFLTAAYLEDAATLASLRQELAACAGGNVTRETLSWSALAHRLGGERAGQLRSQIESVWGGVLSGDDQLQLSIETSFANSPTSVVALSFASQIHAKASFPLIVLLQGPSGPEIQRGVYRITGRQAQKELRSIAFAMAETQVKALVGGGFGIGASSLVQ